MADINWGVVGRVGAAIASGGATELGIAIASREVEAAQAQAATYARAKSADEKLDQIIEMLTALTEMHHNSPIRYQLDGKCLVDAQSGRVWVLDEATNLLREIPREQTKAEIAWKRLLHAKAYAALLEDTAVERVKDTDQHYKNVMKALQAYLDQVSETLKTSMRAGG
jgi:hypothetical protein